ncbi:YwmB family TATA-box binding protein [Garciella nitratireducens]|uniref:YwmB family TATA-box binding protein n=1 Tax=Garciella nitratireducens TaxID=218205 RepID=UPI001BD6391A|nr:YwmB family TATA-box binding protein [Garciella nitratireducens]
MKNFVKGLGIAIIICILSFSILGFFKEVPANQQINLVDAETLMKSFHASEANLESIKLNFGSEIENKKYTQKQMEKIILDCIQELGLEKQSKIEIKKDQNHQKVTATSQKGEEIYVNILMENLDVEEQSKNTYFLIDLCLNEHNSFQLSEIERKIINYFTELGLDYQYSMTVIGTFDKKINTDEMRGIIKNTFEVVDAKILEGMQQEQYSEMVSMSGYSPQIYNNIQLSGKKMNINAAMRYNEYNEKTYLWIGVPLIATEY